MSELVPKDYKRRTPCYAVDQLRLERDDLGRAHYFSPNGRRVCGRLKREKNRKIPNEACCAPPMRNGACRVHGGKAGAPIKHGRYARVTKRWKADFMRALSDQHLLDTRAELALMDVVLERLTTKAEELDCPSWREDLRKTYAELNAAVKAKSQRRVATLMAQLGQQIEQGAQASQVTKDLMVELDRRAGRANKMSELELRREEKITPQQLGAVFGKILEVLERALGPKEYFAVLPVLKLAVSGEMPSLPERTLTIEKE